MKKIFSFLLLLTVFSFQSFAQSPTDDQPGDPGSDPFSYDHGFCDGAYFATDLKIGLEGSYMGFIDVIEWHAYEFDFGGNIGPVVSANYPGLKVPVIKWYEMPQSMWEDPQIVDALFRLEQERWNSPYSWGFHDAFVWYIDHL